jgi:hypothetical protein
MGAALQFYKRAAQLPPQRNALYGYATYRLAWCSANLGDRPAALQSFYDVIRHTAGSPGSPDAQALGQLARTEICLVR